jgi:hypothetical protein
VPCGCANRTDQAAQVMLVSFQSRPAVREALWLAAALLLLLATRLWVLIELHILPKPKYLINNWQHLALEDLRADLWGALYGLHSQPPLWNFIIGLNAIACDADAWCVTRSLYLQNAVYTTLIFLCFYATTRLLTGRMAVSLVAATSFCLLPSLFYYENYAFYPHLSLFLSSLLMLGTAIWFTRWERVGLICCGVGLSSLSLTWTLFHTLFIALLMGYMVATAWNTASRQFAIRVALLSLLVAIAPSVKNQISHGIFANGSWFGLHLAQVSPTKMAECRFGTVIDGFEDGQHLGTALNAPAVIQLSRKCGKHALGHIAARPIKYLKRRFFSACNSLSKWPSAYFHPPLNWDNFPTSTIFPVMDAEGDCELKGEYLRIAALAFNLVALMLFPVAAVIDPSRNRRWFFAFAALFVFCFVLTAHAFNDGEQERMRYTVQNFLWLSYTVGLPAAVKWVWSRFRGRGATAASLEHGATG